MDNDIFLVVGKIGICKDVDLKISRIDSKKSDVHFVYIHSIDKKNKCTVSTIMSMYDSNGKFKDSAVYKGYTLPIPKYATNDNHFSGLNKKRILGIDITKIHNIGYYRLTTNFMHAYKKW